MSRESEGSLAIGEGDGASAESSEQAPPAESTDAHFPEVPAAPPSPADTARDAGPATEPESAVESATAPTTQPGRMVVKIVDPNETTRYVYNANYDNVWRQGMAILTSTGFVLDRQDYRLGVMTTRSLPSAQFIEFWEPQHTKPVHAFENAMHNQRRVVRLTISKVEGKPEFYEIGIQVLVERETNPEETIGGPIFVEGSGFGRNAIALRSDYATPEVEPGRWVIIGHDPDLELKLLDALFKRI